MRIGRTLPPAATPIGWRSFFSGLSALFKGTREVERFNRELSEYFGQQHCFLVSSGKAALTLILKALKEQYPERTDVIIPAFTCYSVPSAIVRAGLKIKLCDLAENSFDFDFKKLEPMLKSNSLLCVIPTHLFGLPADIGRLQQMVNDPEVTIIEDAAQAMGSEWQGVKLGTQGDVSFFSLGRGKSFSTVEGGIVLTNNIRLAERVEKLLATFPDYSAFETISLVLYSIALNLLVNPRLFWIPKALPFLKLGETFFDPKFKIKKMTAFQAGLTKGFFLKLTRLQKDRLAHVKYLQTITPCFSTEQNSSISLPLLRFPVLLKNRSQQKNVLSQSEKNGLGIATSYPDTIHCIPELASEFKDSKYPVASDIVQRLVTFPVHKYVRQADRKRLSDLYKDNAV